MKLIRRMLRRLSLKAFTLFIVHHKTLDSLHLSQFGELFQSKHFRKGLKIRIAASWFEGVTFQIKS